MHVLLNNKLVLADDAQISALSPAVAYGIGLFETLKVDSGNPLFFKEHWERFCKGCEILKLTHSLNFSQLQEACYRLINSESISAGTLKYTYFKNSPDNTLLISIGPLRYNEGHYIKGFKATLALARKCPKDVLHQVKSTNYLLNHWAHEEAREHGYDEAVSLTSEGFLSEGTRSNLFWIEGKTLYTPSEDCAILPGVTRAKVLALGRTLGYDVREGRYTVEQLARASEVFFTNSLFGIMPVVRFIDFEYNREGEMTHKLLEAYESLCREP